jgi:hypothetical protein
LGRREGWRGGEKEAYSNIILHGIHALRLTDRVRAAITRGEERMVPERALRALPVRRVHGIRIRRAGLIRLDESREDLPVRGMAVVRGVRADVRAIDGFRPGISHVVALAGVVPRLQLDEVGLEVENLPESVLEVLLPPPVPVPERRVVLELEWGDAHDERFAGGVCAGEVGHVVGGGHDDVPLGVLRPGVPVHGPVKGRELGAEEVGGGGHVLECRGEIDWVPGVGHDFLEFDFPSVVDGVLAKRVR